MLLSLEKRKE